MAKKFKSINRTGGAPDFAWKDGDTTREVYALAAGDFMSPLGDHNRFTAYGPSLVLISKGPGGHEAVEYDIDSPKAWAYLSRIIQHGYATGKVTSDTSDATAKTNRERNKAVAKV